MDPPIRPQTLNTSPYKELIGQLAYQWIAADRPAAGRTYDDCLITLRTLLLTTQNSERTLAIVGAVLKQAIELDKSSQWVERELKFKGMLQGVDRADFLLLELGQVSDQLLDDCNERINRFAAVRQ